MSGVRTVREQNSTEVNLMFPEADKSLAWTLPLDDRAALKQEEFDQGKEVYLSKR